ncbi:MAG: hypothetical protein M1837_000541 [Sclerophora amabilis]|nr:MAG: hypothetical protein M1837_000541 [Sclerophora amabilis]
MDRALKTPSPCSDQPIFTSVSTPDGLGLQRYLMSPGPLDFYDQAFEWLGDQFFPSPNALYLTQIVVTCWALAWLLYRGWQVLNKPLPELIDVLGLDVPVPPQVSLAGIKSDSITLHWDRPETQNSVAKYVIQINGVHVGESSRSETAVTVTGLKPDHFYAVCVIAVNASHFQASSSTIRLKTIDQPQRSSTLIESIAAQKDDDETDLTPSRNSKPYAGGVRLHGSTVETPSSTSAVPSINREQSGSQNHGRKAGSGRRHSPAIASTDAALSQQDRSGNEDHLRDDLESERTIQQLAETLDAIRRETMEVQQQILKEEEDHNTQRESMIQERDRIKHAVKEKDEISADLRKEASNLDRQNRSVQSKRANKVKELQQKKDERQRMREDKVRWDRGIKDMRGQQRKMRDEIEKIREKAEKRVREIRQRINEDQSAMKSMEEEIKLRGVMIKEAEEVRKQSEGFEDDVGVREREKAEEEEDVKWDLKMRELQGLHSKAKQELQKARLNHQTAQERLSWWGSQGSASLSQQSNPQNLKYEEPGSKRISQRRSLQRRSRNNTVSSVSGLPITDSRFNSSPTFASNVPISPFFNVNNGMALPQDPEPPKSDEADVEQLTGGALMSPTANLLLPSNLLGDDDSPSLAMGSVGVSAQVHPPFGGNQLNHLGSPGHDYVSHDPSSPHSSESKSASLFSSPRGSLGNLGTNQSDSFLDNDRRSLNSARGSLRAMGDTTEDAASSTRKFTNLFNLTLNRQRGKTLDNDPPTLGSLKPGQSQSFPRSIDQPQGELDPIGTRRRRGSHTGSWANPMNYLNRNTAPRIIEGDPAPTSDGTPQGKRRTLNMFSPRYDPLDPSTLLREPSSPRPASTTSFENALPRPSTESQRFGWPIPGNGPHRNSPLGADWSVRAGDPWSRGPSRRSSVHHGSGSSLSLSMTPFDDESLHNTLAKQASTPAPIGTRPPSSPKNATPRLNPAAPTFKTVFTRNDARKIERLEKRKEKDDVESVAEETSPPSEQLSRDSQSIHTQTSQTESRDSLEHSASANPSDSPITPGNNPRDKESIFQKISRKGSSSKFNLSRKDKGGLFSKKPEPPTPDEVNEDASGELQLGRSVDSVTSSPSLGGRTNISWHSFRRKTKKGDKAASEASEKASETGEDEDGVAFDTDH